VVDTSISSIEFATKLLVPRRRNDIISRQRLIDQLHEHVHLRVQVLSATAGYGKTTLLADFANDLEVPVCWYSLDNADQDPRVLLEGILSCVRSQFPGFGKVTQSRLLVAEDVIREGMNLVGTLAGEIYTTIGEYFVLVLEDYHTIEDSDAASTLLNLLLDHTPDNCHIIISSRTPVELPAVSTLTLRQQAVTLTVSDLSFTPTEAKELVSTCYDIHLSDEEADRLITDTDGWIVSILLRTRSLQEGGLATGLSALSQWDVFQYLTSEVFEKQPYYLQSFLLASSTLDGMEPQICNQLLGINNSRTFLREIEKRNLFIRCSDSERAWYRYHDLFRRFLQERLLQEDPEQYLLLHRSVALLLEQEKKWNQAITHFLIAERYYEAARIIKSIGEDFHNSGKWTTVSKWIEALPVGIRLSDPDLVLLKAQSLIHLGEVDEAARTLTNILDKVSSSEDWLGRAKVLSWRSAAFRLAGYYAEARSDIETAIHLLKQHNGPLAILGDAHRRLGNIHMEQGRFTLALKHMRHALKCYTAVFDVGRIADMNNSLGVMYKRLGDLSKANMHFEHAREGWQKVGNFGALALTLNNMGMVYQRRGQYDLALDTFRSGLEKARETGYRRAEALILINSAEVLRDSDLCEGALTIYNDGLELARQIMEPYYVAWAKAGMGQTYRLIGNLDKAEVLLKEAISQVEEHGQSYEATLFETQLGIIQYERGEYGNALSTLSNLCKPLSASGDKDALARLYFHLGQAAFLAKRLDVALEWLNKTSGLVDELGYDDFLAIEGRNSVPLVQYAALSGVGGNRFTRIMEKIRKNRDNRQSLENDSVPTNSFVATKPDIKVHALGETRVLVNGRPTGEAEWRSSKAKELFFYLLCHNTGQTKEQVVAALWPDITQAKANSNFHINLYRARRAIFPGVFTIEHGRYRFNPDLTVWFDAREFENYIVEAASLPDTSISAKAVNLERAIGLYQGAFMDEFYSEWVEIPRRQYEDKYLKTLSSLARINSKQGKYNSAIILLEKFMAIEPYDDDVYCQVMEYHLAAGDNACALRTYRHYIDTVASEAEVVPSERVQGLYRRAVVGSKMG
jgi:LuxR family maltose regulon positive regulatory protein